MRTIFAIVTLAGWAMCGSAYGQECSQTIEGNDLIKFILTEIRVAADCGEVTITLTHVGSLAANVMGHNWVLTATPDFDPVASAGQSAGPPNFVPEGDPRVIAATDVIGGGEETSVTFDISALEVGGDYTFFCSFPGHFVLMNGKFIIE
jgi:azurin